MPCPHAGYVLLIATTLLAVALGLGRVANEVNSRRPTFLYHATLPRMARDLPTHAPTAKVSPWGVVIAALILAWCSYLIAYLALGERWTMRLNSNRQIMNFRYEWQATLFRPAAQLDSLVFRRRVTTDFELDRP